MDINTAIGMAARGDRRAKINLLLQAMVSAPARYQFPAEIPVYGASVWATSTAYVLGAFVSNGAKVYMCAKAGTSAGSGGPTGKSPSITDNTVIWHYIGYIAPVAYANSLALVLDQLFVANSRVYRVTVAGTTSASGSGPSGVADGTDGTVSFAYVSEQTLPIISVATSTGLSQICAWNSTTVTRLGGTQVKEGVNNWGALKSVSADGNAYSTSSGGGGSFYVTSDAPLIESVYASSTIKLNVWVDGELAAFVYRASNSSYYIRADSSGLIRKPRDFRWEGDSNAKFFGIYATATDSIFPYTPANDVRGVILGDSFVEGLALGMPLVLSYATRVGHLIGIEDWRNAGLGGTGVLQTNGGNTNYTNRLTQDVISQNPDLVVTQLSQNDSNGVPGTFSQTQLNTAVAALLTNVAGNRVQVMIGVWNNRGPLSATPAGVPYITNDAATTAAAAAGVPFIEWGSLLTDGGYVGATSGTGSSQYLTGSDGTHPSYPGHILRAGFVNLVLRQKLNAAFRALL